MTGIDVLIVLSVLNFVLLPCEATIFPPPDGTELTFLPGNDAKIRWSFDSTPDSKTFRGWYLINDDGTTQQLGRILGAGTVADKVSLGFAIEQGAILVIKNFDENKNGKYRFVFPPNEASEVVVSVIKKPTVTLTCSSVVSLKEGEDFTCTCLAENGNPKPNVTWHKDGKQIDRKGKNNKTLELNNVNPQNDGTYTCKAESYPDPKFIAEKSIQLTVKPFSKPSGTEITFTPPSPAVIDSKVIVKCTSDGHPEPSYTIIHNGKEISSKSTWKIASAKSSDAGTYECFVKNRLGNDSQSKNLTVKGNTCSNDSSSSGITEWHIVGTLVAGIVIGVILCYIVWFSHRKLRNRNPQPNPEPSTSPVDLSHSTYEELDLTKMNKEDNYQSLRGNAAKHENDSTYTELSKTRDVENNYQSLKR